MNYPLGFIISDSSSQYFWKGQSLFSLKSFSGGIVNYKIENKRYTVSGNNYLVVENDQYYEIEIDSLHSITSFCIFFKPDFLQNHWNLYSIGNSQLLDCPNYQKSFYNWMPISNTAGDAVHEFLIQGRKCLNNFNDPLWVGQYFYNALDKLFLANHTYELHANALSFEKVSTRKEISQRLLLAKEFMNDNYFSGLTLTKIADVASMSPNHFIRTFKQLFHVTPFQYMTHIRMCRSMDWLKNIQIPISEVAEKVGYSSVTSFTTSFRLKFGLTPAEFRKKVIQDK